MLGEDGMPSSIDNNLPLDPAHLSPSLRRDRSGGAAFEVKFLLPNELAREVERRATSSLVLDPHTDPALHNAYRTTTLYCDTPSFDVFHSVGPCRNRKHRVRRYGQAPLAFLEQKTKRGSQVSKRRTAVPCMELAELTNATPASNITGEWFLRRLRRYALHPVCRVSYERTAYSGATSEGPLRLTFDRGLRGCLAGEWNLTPVVDGPDLLNGWVIVEFKFQGSLPSLGKRVVEDLRLVPGSASKYRRFLIETGLRRDACTAR